MTGAMRASRDVVTCGGIHARATALAVAVAAGVATMAESALAQPPPTRFAELHQVAFVTDQRSVGRLSFADVDGDGDADALALPIVGAPLLLANDGTARFAAPTPGLLPPAPAGFTADAAAIGDVDGDGDPDLVLVARSVGALLYRNDVRAAGRFVDASAAQLPPLGERFTAAVLADVDRDGDLDLVLAGAWRESAPPVRHRLLVNDGHGTFADATLLRLPVNVHPATSVLAVDLDGDGDQDLLFDHALLQNDGAGTFTDVTAARLPAGTYAALAAAGDIDGDGDVDLILPNERDRVLINVGGGWFADGGAGRIPLGAPPYGVLLADLDRDGDLDLVRGNARLHLNDGNGVFPDASAGRVPEPSATFHGAPAAVDADGDGDLDLAFTRIEYTGPALSPALFLNDGGARFVDASAPSGLPLREPLYPYQSRLLDVDGDGDLDLFVVGGAQHRLYLNDGDNRWRDATDRLPSRAWGDLDAVPVDVDGDLDLDLVLTGSTYGPKLYVNDGRGAFADVTSAQLPAAFAANAVPLDADGDGDVDLALGDNGRPAVLYRNDGRGVFAPNAGSLPATATRVVPLAAADVDGDGDVDLLAGLHDQPLQLWRNDGHGTFVDASAGRLPPGTIGGLVALTDLDADGDADLLVTSAYAQHRLFLNDGSGSFTDVSAQRMPPTIGQPNSLLLGDLEDDGDLDALLVGNGVLLAFANDGTARFTDVSAVAFGTEVQPQWQAAQAGDLDHDGDVDLVLFGPYLRPRLYMNLLRHVHAPRIARAGAPWALSIYADHPLATAPGAAALLVSAQRLEPRVPLGAFGRLGVDPQGAVLLPPLAIPPPGVRELALMLPRDPALRGVAFHVQALVTQRVATVPAALTNVLSETIVH